MSPVIRTLRLLAIAGALLATVSVGCSKKRGTPFDPDSGHPEDFFATHGAVEVVNIRGETAPLSFLQGRPCVLFSGIARPESFEETIRSLGARPRAAFRFIDHHAYVAKDIGAMLGEWVEGGVFITTEKDLAKAAALFPAGIDVRALRIEMKVSGLDRLLALIASASS